jgi:hypothetical protein
MMKASQIHRGVALIAIWTMGWPQLSGGQTRSSPLAIYLAGRQQGARPTPQNTNTTPSSQPGNVASSVITIAAVGDVMIGSTYPDESALPPNDGGDLMKPFYPVLHAADFTFGLP